MKSIFLFMSMLWLLSIPLTGMAQDLNTEQQAAVVPAEVSKAVSEVIVLEDGTEEMILSNSSQAPDYRFADDRVLTIQNEARDKIAAVMMEIHQLNDGNDEGRLQKKIERIKLDAEIARFQIYLQDAEDAQDFERVYEIRDEITHMENLSEPKTGIPEEQPNTQN